MLFHESYHKNIPDAYLNPYRHYVEGIQYMTQCGGWAQCLLYRPIGVRIAKVPEAENKVPEILGSQRSRQTKMLDFDARSTSEYTAYLNIQFINGERGWKKVVFQNWKKGESDTWFELWGCRIDCASDCVTWRGDWREKPIWGAEPHMSLSAPSDMPGDGALCKSSSSSKRKDLKNINHFHTSSTIS